MRAMSRDLLPLAPAPAAALRPLRATIATVLLALVVGGALATGVHAADDPEAFEGDVVARVSVTVDPDSEGTIDVPSPFAILPDGERVAICVPESDGIFLLKGPRILHHFSLPAGMHDLTAAGDLLVAGRWLPEGSVTVELHVFDLTTHRPVEVVRSFNPHLRMAPGEEDYWRVVIEGGTVGVYHPPTGASYPLWSRDGGPIAGTDQMTKSRGGIGLGEGSAWVPLPDDSVALKVRGSSTPVLPAEGGAFLDGIGEEALLFLPPAESVRSDADGDFLLPLELAVARAGIDGTSHEFRFVSMDPAVKTSRLVIRGRPVRVRGDRVYWIFLGYDYLEIRSLPVTVLQGVEG